LCSELKAMRVASQKEALGRNFREGLTCAHFTDAFRWLNVPDAER